MANANDNKGTQGDETMSETRHRFGRTLEGHPPIGSEVRYLLADRLDTNGDSMGELVGRVTANYPADPDEPDDRGSIGVQFARSPYCDGSMALHLADEGREWGRVK